MTNSFWYVVCIIKPSSLQLKLVTENKRTMNETNVVKSTKRDKSVIDKEGEEGRKRNKVIVEITY